MMWVTPQKHTRAQSPHRYAHVKYSNGGCSGFEPDFLFIYSVHNFSNRIFPTLFCFQLSIPYFSSDCKRKRKDSVGKLPRVCLLRHFSHTPTPIRKKRFRQSPLIRRLRRHLPPRRGRWRRRRRMRADRRRLKRSQAAAFAYAIGRVTVKVSLWSA